ncbi:MAG: AbrB/MazE/SpoVT family DNA-binding domain-containing protein [Rhodocyclaceae bacterium]|nr:AbrB/MazE/SpoVT family DNA-binding domain-containing protein [Rhodocyclaceae bacterium]
MQAVTVSPKFQVVIPQKVREQLHIEVGQKLQVLAIGQRIEMLPIESAQSLRGFLPGLDTTVSRDSDRV